MAKAAKQVMSKTKAHKPAKKGKRGKQRAAAQTATTAAVKRSAPKSNGSPFVLSRADRELQAELLRLRDAVYKPAEPRPHGRPSSKAWDAYRERHMARQGALQEAVDKALDRCRDPQTQRARKYRSPAQLVTLAVVGGFSVEADRYLGEMIRQASGLADLRR